MKPPQSPDCEAQGEPRMKKTQLARLINPEHPLLKLAQTIDWQNFDEHFEISYSTQTGRPGISTRL
jgi:transposase, IS5 family